MDTQIKGKLINKQEIVSRLYAVNPKHFEQFTILFDCDLFNTKLSDAALRLYQVFKWYYFKYGNACIFPSQDKLATQIGKSERQTRNLLFELKSEGYIKTERQGKMQTNNYYLLDKWGIGRV